MIGRWSPDGSDDYVRTYKAAVRDLIARFANTVAAGRSYEAFDEEDAYVQVQVRIIGQVGEEAAVEAAIVNLKNLAADISKKTAATEELASPTEVASVSLAVPPGDVEDEDLFKTKYLIVYTHNRRCARLHLAGGCWRARQLSFACFEYVDQDPPPREAYNAVCRGRWPGRSGEDLEEAEGEGGMEASDTTVSTEESS